jgi:hypothetical protein
LRGLRREAPVKLCVELLAKLRAELLAKLRAELLVKLRVELLAKLLVECSCRKGNTECSRKPKDSEQGWRS